MNLSLIRFINDNDNWKDVLKFAQDNHERKDVANYILNKDRDNSNIYFSLLDGKFDISEIKDIVMGWQNKKIIERI